MTDTAAAPSEGEALQKRGSWLVVASAALRRWLRELARDFGRASPGEQITQVYYAGKVIAGLAALGMVSAGVWLWIVHTAKETVIPSAYATYLGQNNSPADAQRALDRLPELSRQMDMLRALRPKWEIELAIKELNEGRPDRIVQLLHSAAEEAARQNEKRKSAERFRGAAVGTFAFDKRRALDELEKAVAVDPTFWQAWYDLGDVAAAAGETKRAEQAFWTALDLAGSTKAMPLDEIKIRIRLGDILIERGMPAAGLIKLDEALGAIKNALLASPKDTALLAEKANVLIRVGDYLAETSEEQALPRYTESLGILQMLASGEPSAQRQSDLAAAHVRIGNMLRKRGDIPSAEAAYNKAHTIARQIADSHPEEVSPLNIAFQKDLVISYGHLGKLFKEEGRREHALRSFEHAVSIAVRVADLDKQNVRWQRELALALNRVGDLRRELGKADEALASYGEANRILTKLSDQDETNSALQKHLVQSFIRIGDLGQERKDFAAASVAYEKAGAIIDRQGDPNSLDNQWRSRLVSVEGKRGEILRAQDDVTGARAKLERSLGLAKWLVTRGTRSMRSQREFILALNRMGDFLHDLKEQSAAIYHQQAADAARGVVVSGRAKVQWQLDLVAILSRLAKIGIDPHDNLKVVVEAYDRLDGKVVFTAQHKEERENARIQFAKLNQS
jgi:tetratricopeptide (TPR) repeat protein